jgi:hypothetical protein
MYELIKVKMEGFTFLSDAREQPAPINPQQIQVLVIGKYPAELEFWDVRFVDTENHRYGCTEVVDPLYPGLPGFKWVSFFDAYDSSARL